MNTEQTSKNIFMFSKACLKIPKLLSSSPKKHICNTSCIEINTLFAFINKIELGTSKELKDKRLNNK